MALGSTQSVTEMSTSNLPGGKGWPARKADNFTSIYEPTVQTNCGSLDATQLFGPSWPVTGIALSFLPSLPDFIWIERPRNRGSVPKTRRQL
jgi:hypothetical protein